jgi:hypothetical protein
MSDDGRETCLTKDIHHVNSSELDFNGQEQKRMVKDSLFSRYHGRQ